MQYTELGKTGLKVPRIITGFFRASELPVSEARELIDVSLEAGVNFFDHADVYGAGKSESLFAEAFGKGDDKRENIILQSKCGIRPDISYDFSKEHILEAVDGSLQRLKTDYLDVLLLHRPDALIEPEQVAEAFSILHGKGKVKHFGVSNFSSNQIELLKKDLPFPIVTNQMQLSVVHSPMVRNGLHVNVLDDDAIVRDGGVLDYCRLHDITVQAWSPIRFHIDNGTFIDSPSFPELNAKLEEIGAKYGVSKTAIAVAWILRHPAKMQVVAGTTKAWRLKEYLEAGDVNITHTEWYEILISSGFVLV
ncbi:MAG: aldo/keto reductase [Clostridiales Family XIII bacterium]|jgi:predicted oxidoreductase|nr:aldo/keto reductase [Clostridiales Family XIII bacterium]